MSRLFPFNCKRNFNHLTIVEISSSCDLKCILFLLWSLNNSIVLAPVTCIAQVWCWYLTLHWWQLIQINRGHRISNYCDINTFTDTRHYCHFNTKHNWTDNKFTHDTCHILSHKQYNNCNWFLVKLRNEYMCCVLIIR